MPSTSFPKHLATQEGTVRFFDRHTLPFSKKREFDGVFVSALGMGSHLGDLDETTNRQYEETFCRAIEAGVNIFDTAAHYRRGQSEVALGRAFHQFQKMGVDRSQYVVMSKAGKIPFEAGATDLESWIQGNLLQSGIVRLDDLAANDHCISPSFLSYSLQRSLQQLQLSCLDVYFLYNPEVFLLEMGEAIFLKKIHEAFLFFEQMVQDGKIARYGISTWNGFRQHKNALQLEQLLQIAQQIAGDQHHFRAVQLPLNLVMLESLAIKNQKSDKQARTIFEVAKEHKIAIHTSAALMQGHVLNLPERIFSELSSAEPAISALQFVLSTPGICSGFVGVRTIEHLQAAISSLTHNGWPKEQWLKALETLGVNV